MPPFFMAARIQERPAASAPERFICVAPRLRLAPAAALIRRDVYEISGQPVSKEIALMITSRIPEKMTAAGISRFTRKHWGIENKSHYVRDTVYREDHNQAWTGNGPQALAITHNLAISLMRLKGVKAIKETTEWIAADRTRAYRFMIT